VDGKIKVVTVPSTAPTSITVAVGASQLELSWPLDHIGWRLQAQTNSLGVGLSTNWFTVPGSTSTNRVIVPIDAASPTAFFRLLYP
jgi:hypothetical protein